MFLKTLSRLAAVLYWRREKATTRSSSWVAMNYCRAHPQRRTPNIVNLSCALVVVLFMLGFPSHSAQAYIGPGVGAGVVATVLGVVSSIFLLLIGIIYYPIKRAVKMLKGKDKLSKSADSLTPKRR